MPEFAAVGKTKKWNQLNFPKSNLFSDKENPNSMSFNNLPYRHYLNPWVLSFKTGFWPAIAT